MNIEILPGCDRPEEIGALFREYTDMLVEGDPDFAVYLDQQHYEEELRHLEAKYGGPAGRLVLARADGEAAGCVALRRMSDTRCELKRLYVRPAFRGRGLGRTLTERMIAEARQIGYRDMVLDTLPFLTEAISLYRRLGFQEIAQYNDSPMQEAVYLRLEL